MTMKVALIGPPGGGKTTLALELGLHYKAPVTDFDNDILEKLWGCPVADKLKQLGDDSFLDAENDALCQCDLPTEGIFSLSGSNPCRPEGMQRLVDAGWLLLWNDVPKADILSRLQAMKVNRIVGQSVKSMSDVLAFRQQFYERWYHIRAFQGLDHTIEQNKREIIRRLTWHSSPTSRRLVSTRTLASEATHSLSEAILNGLAPDGGLFLQQNFPKILSPQLARMVEMTYQEKARVVLEKLIHPSDISPQKLEKMVNDGYSSFEDPAVVPVEAIGDNTYVAELFHGPSGSFKDLALQMTPQLVSHFLGQTGTNSLVVVATSGDTGSAVLEGFGRFGGDNVAVLVMYPTTGISDIQKQQMVTFKARNVKVVAVNGNFDDCQRLVKSLFVEKQFLETLKSSYNLTLNTANSINWGRLLPQIVYHFHIYLSLVKDKVFEFEPLATNPTVDLTVPSGNFGNMLSALIAKDIGVPYGEMHIASNDNNILADFMNTGSYDLRDRNLKATISPAIDILVSSNLERWICLRIADNGEGFATNPQTRVKELYEKLKTDRFFKVSDKELENIRVPYRGHSGPDRVHAAWCDESKCLNAIQNTVNTAKYLADPHTGVALAVSNEHKTDRVKVVLSTAHHSKFPGALESIKGAAEVLKPAVHKGVASCLSKEPVHKDTIDPIMSSLKEVVSNFVGNVFETI